MSQDDPNIAAAIYRARQIEAEIAAAQADLATHNMNDDTQAASYSVQQIADLSAQKMNVINLYNNYVASRTPRPQQPVSQEERAARPWDRMDWQDVVEMTRNSKWAKNIRPDDPNMIAGFYEAQRRRGRGE